MAAAQLAGAMNLWNACRRVMTPSWRERVNLERGPETTPFGLRSLLLKPRVLILDGPRVLLILRAGDLRIGNLSKMAAGRTVIMISHRLSTLVHADAILVMQQGSWLIVGGMKNCLRVAPPTNSYGINRQVTCSVESGGRRNPQTAIDFLPDADEIERRRCRSLHE